MVGDEYADAALLEKGDDALFVKLQEAIKEPYSDKFDEFFQTRPEWATQQAGCSMLFSLEKLP